MSIRVFEKPVTFGGSTDEGSDYDTFKRAIKENCGGLEEVGNGELRVAVQLFILKERVKPGRNDLDNFLKPVIDALDEADVLDESQIASIWIDRVKVDYQKDEGVEIGVVTLP